MTLQQILDYVNFVSAKDVSGEVLDPVRMNRILPAVNLEFFNEQAEKLKRTIPGTEKEYNSLDYPVKKFIVEWSTFSNSSYVTPPVDFETPYTIVALDSMAKVQVLDEEEFASARTSLLQRDVKNNPVCVHSGGLLRFLPQSIPSLLVSYLRLPQTPYFDYCIDANDNYVYMPVGSYINEVDGVNVLYSVNDDILATDVTHSGLNSLPHLSESVELEWDQRTHDVIANRILEKMGVNIQSPEIMQYTQVKKQQGA